MINTILIANRGEIARRIIRTCRRLGIRTVAVYSEADRGQPFVGEADEAVCIGEAAAAKSYLDGERIIAAAHLCGADAIHPGYGFLSENAAFARRVREAGLRFIGPRPEAIEAMGSKSRAKAIVEAQGVPVIPGYRGEAQGTARLAAEAVAIGFPLLLKAAAGGGGKGMRIVHEAAQLEAAIEAARREARAAFGDDELLIEKYFPSARHIEFQVFGDQHGNLIHLRERECSIQRRHQKVFEESPSPALSEEERRRMGAAAVDAARAIGYDNAGTVEFIHVGPGEFYFLEVNTRLQVEHPVTEMITGIDLVAWQIRVAEGQPLPLTQDEVRAEGYALECRLYAEDARNRFLPVTGRVLRWEPAPLEGLRYESAVESGADISIHYDPMIAKIIAHGADRHEAIRRLRYALGNLVCLGLTTNLPFLLRVLGRADFAAGDYDTHYIDNRLDLGDLYEYSAEVLHHAAIALMLYRRQQREGQRRLLRGIPGGWRNNFFQPQEETFQVVETDLTVGYRYRDGGRFDVTIGGQAFAVQLLHADSDGVAFEADGRRRHFAVARDGQWYFLHLPGAGQLIAQVRPRFPELAAETADGGYQAPMPGEVIRVLAEAGRPVRAGQSLLILSSMKMENLIAAAEDGIVEEVFVSEGQHVEAGMTLLRVTADAAPTNEETDQIRETRKQ